MRTIIIQFRRMATSHAQSYSLLSNTSYKHTTPSALASNMRIGTILMMIASSMILSCYLASDDTSVHPLLSFSL